MSGPTLPAGHPPFARPAKGTPAWALPFGRQLCDNIAPLLAGAGALARAQIERMAMQDMGKDCQPCEIRIDGVRLRIFRHIVGPAPMSVRFGIQAGLPGHHSRGPSYSQGLVTIDAQVADALVIAMKGRILGNVVELPEGFPGANRRIISAHQNTTHYPEGTITSKQKAFTHSRLVLRVAHRQDFLSYDHIEHGRPDTALAA